MCFETSFPILNVEKRSIPAGGANPSALCFRFDNEDIIPPDDYADAVKRDMLVMLKDQVGMIAKSWDLELTIRFRQEQKEETLNIPGFDFEVTGDILDAINSTVVWNDDRKCHLKLAFKLEGMKDNDDAGTEPALLTSLSSIHLFPGLANQNLAPAPINYTAFTFRTGLGPIHVEDFNSIQRWKISELLLEVVSFGCNCAGPHADAHATQVNRTLLEDGVGHNLFLVTKKKGTVGCIKSILTAQSPVLKSMLKKGRWRESATRVIQMDLWTEKEVKEFLVYAYYGGTKAAQTDPDMNLSLYKMADFYQIPDMKAAMKNVYMKRPLHLITIMNAFQMFEFASIMQDEDLKTKAIESLRLYSVEKFMAEIPTVKESCPELSAWEVLVEYHKRI